MQEGRWPEAREKLETLIERRPDRAELRYMLGIVYFNLALDSLRDDAADPEATNDLLERALDELVEVARLEPRAPQPHTQMGIVSVYQGDLDSAIEHFGHAQVLDPRSFVHYMNLAEIHLLAGRVSVGRHWARKARLLAAPPAAIEYLDLIAALRTGDLEEARDLFRILYALDRPFVTSRWEPAGAPEEIESLDDLIARCCNSVVCGPYMRWVCERRGVGVRELILDDELRRVHLRREAERRQRLREIYEERKELEIEVEPVETEPEPPDETDETSDED